MPTDKEHDVKMTVGQMLRSERIRVGASLQEVAAFTKIRMDLLEKLENNSFLELPPSPYIEGFVRSYGRFLKFDPDEIVKLFQSTNGTSGEGYVPHAPNAVGYSKQQSSNGILLLASMIVLVIVGIGLIAKFYGMNAGWSRSSAIENSAPIAVASVLPKFHSDRSSVGSKSKGVMLAIVVQLKSNIQVFRDDEPVFTGLVEPGERFEWNGDRSVFLISDNAGGLFVELDGAPMTRLGAVGERIEKEWKAVD